MERPQSMERPRDHGKTTEPDNNSMTAKEQRDHGETAGRSHGTMAGMSNRRRLPQNNNRAEDHKDRSNNGSQSALFGEDLSALDGPEFARLQDALAAAGVSDELVSQIFAAETPEDAMRMLVESGHLPSEDEAYAGMLNGFKPLLTARASALDAELSGAEFLATLREAAFDPKDVPTLLAELASTAEASGRPEALAMLRILAVTGPDEIRHTATAAADRLVASGLKDCRWVSDLGSPRVGACFGYGDDLQRAITITFSYGRKHHAISVLIDYGLGGGVKDCWLSDKPSRLRAEFQRVARRSGLDFQDHAPEQARAILDRALAQPPCPDAPDQVEDVRCYLDLLRQRVALLPTVATSTPAGGKTLANAAAKGRGHTVHRLKISLRGARPPIWRRMEVPSNITLQRLHRVIQVAFGWEDYHLWVFETPSGAYGQPDPELGHRSASAKKLLEVAPHAGGRLAYTYDFGDDWQHEILVEDVVEAEPKVAYPRCVTGRRACPPEDCGGIWGYAELLKILANPEHEGHEERLEWLGLDSADDFDPAAFDAAAVNEALSGSARVLVKP